MVVMNDYVVVNDYLIVDIIIDINDQKNVFLS